VFGAGSKNLTLNDETKPEIEKKEPRHRKEKQNQPERSVPIDNRGPYKC